MEKINLSSAKDNGISVRYHDTNIALCDDLRNLHHLPQTVITECFMIVLVKSGRATFKIGDHHYDLVPSDLFVCTPRNVTEAAMTSTDFDAFTFILSPDYVMKILRQTPIDIAPIYDVGHEAIRLNESDELLIAQFYELLNTLYAMPRNNANEIIIDHVTQALAHKFHDLFKANTNRVSTISNFSAAENIFKNFLMILRSSNKQIQNVGFYAEQLNITPKYFSSICKRVTGKTAYKIIEEEIVDRACILLRDNRLTIKQIANELGFANQSHFGTFFRRHTKLSPQHYRQEQSKTE